jgi:hypothetical protein
VAFPSPHEAALAGDHTSPQTRVLAQVVGENDAVVILMSPGWPQPDCVLCRRSDGGWIERGTTSGQTVWSSSDDDESLGVYACWGRAKPGAVAVLVTVRGATITIPVENDHYVWLIEGVPIDVMDEPVEFRWLP